MNSFQLFTRSGRSALRSAFLAIALLLAFVSSGLAQLTFPTFSGRVVSGPDDTGLAGVGVSWTLSPNNGGASGGGGFTTTDANGNYSGTFNAATEGSGFEWRFTFTKANHKIDGFDRRVVGFSGNFVMPNPSVVFGPLTGQILSGTFGLLGATVFPGTPITATAAQFYNIPDNGGVESPRGLDWPGFIASVAYVQPMITHPRAGDLEITLVHPDGTEVRLRMPTPIQEPTVIRFTRSEARRETLPPSTENRRLAPGDCSSGIALAELWAGWIRGLCP